MKELRELYDKATQGKWRSLANWGEVCTDYDDTVCDTNTQEDARLIAAMHNALPELLDAWEKWSALMFARQQRCETCPMNVEGDRTSDNCGICDVALFYCLPQWRQAWRDAHADTKTD